MEAEQSPGPVVVVVPPDLLHSQELVLRLKLVLRLIEAFSPMPPTCEHAGDTQNCPGYYLNIRWRGSYNHRTTIHWTIGVRRW
jgi:hypothetical protein